LRVDGDWRNNSSFTIDTISAMILLIQPELVDHHIDNYAQLNPARRLGSNIKN